MKNWINTLLCLCVSLMFVGCASVPRPDVSLAAPSPPPYEAWGRVLNRYVDDQGRVNFAGIAKDRADLDQFVAYIYDNGPNNQPQLFPTAAHVLAFHINAYNALAMHKVVVTGIPDTFAGFKKVGFFLLGKVQVGAEPISLYDYENKVIRPLGDTRIHMVLNCMAVSCPRLPREVFKPELLEVQLEREATKFFNEERNVLVNNATKSFKVSEILKFYTSDFLAKSPSLAAYVNRYREEKVPESYAVEFFSYDWTINRTP
jgi:hypothetical protein